MFFFQYIVQVAQLQTVHAASYLSVRVDPASAVRLPVRPMLNLVCRVLAVSCKSIVSTHIFTRKKDDIHNSKFIHTNRFELLPNQNEIIATWLILPLVLLSFFIIIIIINHTRSYTQWWCISSKTEHIFSIWECTCNHNIDHNPGCWLFLYGCVRL